MRSILIVEDELIVANNIAEIVSANLEMAICGIVTNAVDALKVVKVQNPTLIICDIAIKGEINGIELMQLISQFSYVPFLYLTAFSDKSTLIAAAATNPSAFLVKPFTQQQLLAAINMAFLPSAQEFEMKTRGLEAPPTKRETEILGLLAKGENTKSIADMLDLSDLTVQTHRKNLIVKYGVRSMNELVAKAIRNNWIRGI